jgi:hypothetical protein
MEPGVYMTPNKYAALVLRRDVADRLARNSRDDRESVADSNRDCVE